MWRACRSMEMKRPWPPGTSPGGTAYATPCSKSVQNMVSIKVQNVSLLYYGGIPMVLRDGQGWSGMVRDAQGRSRMLRDAPGCSGTLRDAQEC